MREELQAKLNASLDDKSSLNVKLEETRALLKELEHKYKTDTSSLAERAQKYKTQLVAVKKDLQERWQTQEGVQRMKAKIQELENKVRSQ